MERTKPIRAAVVGDEHPAVPGHMAIQQALAHAAEPLALAVEARWLSTSALRDADDDELADYDAVWCGPFGPYQYPDAALGAIRRAREGRVPFLGTCAGFQQAVIEYARSVLGLTDADHAEANPAAARPVIAPLLHPLMERTGAVVLDPASRTAAIYGRTAVAERYRCRFGLNPEYLRCLHHAGLRVAGVDEEGLATVVEFPDHPFFVATLFMPEHGSRAALPHPLVTALVRAAAQHRAERGGWSGAAHARTGSTARIT